MDSPTKEEITTFQSRRNSPAGPVATSTTTTTSSFWDFFKIPSFLKPSSKTDSLLPIPAIKINSGDGPMIERESSKENENDSLKSQDDDDTTSIDTNQSTRSLDDDTLVMFPTAGGSDPETSSMTKALTKRRSLGHIITPEDAKLLSAAELNNEITKSILRSRVTRPRLASHPNFNSPSYLFPDLQTAPILGGSRRKSIFYHLRRASHVVRSWNYLV